MRAIGAMVASVVSALLMQVVLASRTMAQQQPMIEVVTQIGHKIGDAAISPDGRQVVSGGTNNGTLKIWDTASGALLRTLNGHTAIVASVAFSPDGRQVASSSYDKTIKLWDLASGALLRTIARPGSADVSTSIAFSPDGQRLVSAEGLDKVLRLWEVASGTLLFNFAGHSAPVNSVAFSPDGRNVISGSHDNTIKLWDAATGMLLHTYNGHSNWVRSVAFSPDGRQVLSGSFDKTMKLWSAANGALLRTFKGHLDVVRSVAFSPDGQMVLSGSWDQTLKLWDAASGDLLRTLEGHSDRITAVAFSRDGRQLFSGSSDATMRMWNAASGAMLRTFEGQSDSIRSVAFSFDGAQLVSAGADKTLKLWDVASGALMRSFQVGTREISSVAFSPSKRQVLSGSYDGTLKLWDAATGRLVRMFEGHSHGVTSAAFSPDGWQVLSGSNDKTLKLWDVASGGLLRTFEGHTHAVEAVAFSPDGRRLLSGGGGDKTMKLWDAASGELLRTFKEETIINRINSVAFSPDGQQVLSGNLGATLKLWDVASGALLRTFEGHSNFWVNSVAFSPNGQQLLSGGADMTLKLWDAATGRLQRTLMGHTAQVLSVAFSPDGKKALSGGVDGTVRVWDVASGSLLTTQVGTPSGQWITITPEGFFSGSGKTVDRMLSLTRGLELTTIGQVHQSLFNPDLVRAALAGDPDGEVRSAAKFINMEKVLNSGPAPKVIITSHAEVSQSNSDVITVGVRVTDGGKGIGRIEWRINGVTAAVTKKPNGTGPDYELIQQLALDEGDNTIEVVAYNESNLLASLAAKLIIKFIGSPDQAKPKLHIVAVGINAYRDKGSEGSDTAFGKLSLAVKDAETLAADMARAAIGQYGKVNVVAVLDEEATKSKLDKLISEIAAEVHPRDTFILFFAAHGVSVAGRYHLIPQDYDGGTDPTALGRRAINEAMLQDWLANKIKAKKAVLLLDTCESGALIAGHIRSRTDAGGEAAIGRIHEATGRPVLTASALGQYAYEDSENKLNVRHGLFTWALLQALRNGDSDGDGLIQLSEFVGYVQDHVPKLAAKLGGSGIAKSAISGATITTEFKQQARFGSRGEDFVLVRRLQ